MQKKVISMALTALMVAGLFAMINASKSDVVGVNDYFGWSIATGDFNNDGYEDTAIGAYKGCYVNIFFGSSSGLNLSSVDLNLTGSTGEDFGFSLAVGDFNNDGYDDLLVGADYYNAGDGRAYIFLGSSNMDSNPDLTIPSQSSGENFGYAVAVGDFNNDGYDDALIGAYYYNAGDGRAYIFYGNASLDSVVDVTLQNQSNSEEFGFSLAVGDFNSDGYDDALIGADNYNAGDGRAYIFYGGPSMDSTADLILSNQSSAEVFGVSVAVGDFNNDSSDDALIGSAYNGGDGRAYIFLGGTAIDANVDLILPNQESQENFGYSLSSGDFNNDGYDDALIGAYYYAFGDGRAYIFLGGEELDSNVDYRLFNKTDEYFGYALSSGDFNNDGYGDVIIGAPNYHSGNNYYGRAYYYDALSDLGITVVINEVFYDTNDTIDERDEWIEFYNRGSSVIDIQGWSINVLNNDNTGDTYTFPTGSSININASDYFVISANGANFYALYGFYPDYEWQTDSSPDVPGPGQPADFGEGTEGIDNAGAGIMFLTPAGVECDRLEYGLGPYNDANLNDNAVDVSEGNSLTRDYYSTDTGNYYNDFSETDSPTPKANAPPIPDPYMSITKTASISEATPGDVIMYTITYTNTGLGTAQDVWVNDSLPSYTTFLNSTPLYNSSNGNVYTWHFMNVGAGTSVIYINVSIDLDVPDEESLMNTVTLDYTNSNGQSMAQVIAYAITDVYKPVFTVSKYNDNPNPMPGEIVMYTIAYSNVGAGIAQSVWINDSLPLHTTLLNSTPSYSSSDGRNYTFYFENVGSGNYFIYVNLSINSNALYGIVLNNTVTLEYTDINGNSYEQVNSYSEGMIPIPLYEGWNLISIPLIQSDASIETVLGSIAGNYSIVWAYNAFDESDPWKMYNPSGIPWANDLQEINHTIGIWIDMIMQDYLIVNGTLPGITNITLKEGWNLVGYPSQTKREVSNAMSSIADDYSIVWAYFANDTSDSWKKYSPQGLPWANDLECILPAFGYWIKAGRDATWSVE